MIWMALASFFSAAFGHVIRNAQGRRRNMTWVGAWNYLFAALACGAWWAMRPAAPPARDTVLFGLCGGVFYALGYLIMYVCIREAGVGVTMTVNRLAIAMPIAASIFIWREIPNGAQVCGIALALIAFPLLACGRALPDEPGPPAKVSLQAGRRVGWLAISFGVQGVALLFMKAFSVGALPSAEVPFLCFLFTAAAVTNLAAAAAAGRPRLPDLSHGLALGVTNVLSTYWFMYALDRLPGTEVLLATSVGTILLSAAGAAVLWRERYRRAALLGLLLAAISLVLVNQHKLLALPARR